MSDGLFARDQMAFAGKLPWHGKGKPVHIEGTGPEAWAEMQREAECNFSLGLVDVLAADTGERIPGQHAVRCSDGYLIPATVGRRYTIVQPETLFQTMAQMNARPHTAGTLLGRRKVWALGQLSGAAHTLRRQGDRSTSLPFVLGDNSNDGSSDLTFGLTAIEVVCMNTRAIALAGIKAGLASDRITARHTASVQDRIATAAEVLGLAEVAFRADAEMRQDLANTPMDAPAFATFAAQLLTGKDDPQEAREVVAKAEGRSRALLVRKGDTLLRLFTQGLGNRGDSRLDALNAVTEYVDHGRDRTGTIDWDTKGAAILWGTGAQLKQRAMALVTA